MPYDPNLPLEAVIEARPVPLTLRRPSAQRRPAARAGATVEAAAGEQRSRRTGAGLPRRVPVRRRPTRTPKRDFPITAHAAAWQTLRRRRRRGPSTAARCCSTSRQPARWPPTDLGLVDPEKQQIDDLGDAFLAWARRAVLPTAGLGCDDWNPRHLEYSLARLGAEPGQPGGACRARIPRRPARLVQLRRDRSRARAMQARHRTAAEVTSFMPTTVQFDGMPNTRHWAFEEGATNFGDIDPDTTDIAKLLLIEFGLVFANDWFLLPIDLPVGSLTADPRPGGDQRVRRAVLDRAGGHRRHKFQNWRMFRLTDQGRR